jgi:hypothetical protein
MVDLVEVYWGAGPALRRLGLSIDSGRAERQAQALYGEVNRLAASFFPGGGTLVGTEVCALPGTSLRIVRNGSDEILSADHLLQTLVGYVVERLALDSVLPPSSPGITEDAHHRHQEPCKPS